MAMRSRRSRVRNWGPTVRAGLGRAPRDPAVDQMRHSLGILMCILPSASIYTQLTLGITSCLANGVRGTATTGWAELHIHRDSATRLALELIHSRSGRHLTHPHVLIIRGVVLSKCMLRPRQGYAYRTTGADLALHMPNSRACCSLRPVETTARTSVVRI